MATARKQKNGRWRTLVYVGKQDTKSGYKSFTADTKKESELMAARYLNELEHREKPHITLGEAIDN